MQHCIFHMYIHFQADIIYTGVQHKMIWSQENSVTI